MQSFSSLPVTQMSPKKAAPHQHETRQDEGHGVVTALNASSSPCLPGKVPKRYKKKGHRKVFGMVNCGVLMGGHFCMKSRSVNFGFNVCHRSISLAGMNPIPSMYGIFIFTYIWLIFVVNVGEYTSPMDGNNIQGIFLCPEWLGKLLSWSCCVQKCGFGYPEAWCWNRIGATCCFQNLKPRFCEVPRFCV